MEIKSNKRSEEEKGRRGRRERREKRERRGRRGRRGGGMLQRPWGLLLDATISTARFNFNAENRKDSLKNSFRFVNRNLGRI